MSTESRALAEKAIKLAIQAGLTDSCMATEKSIDADIALIDHHFKNMNETTRARAQETCSALLNRGRRYGEADGD